MNGWEGSLADADGGVGGLSLAKNIHNTRMSTEGAAKIHVSFLKSSGTRTMAGPSTWPMATPTGLESEATK